MPSALAQAVPQSDRLTRDPTATFGGVLSGIAHRYGWDVSFTRLAFVVLLIISGGTAILAYLLSWIIIPRATHWPPPRYVGSRSRLSGRDLGIGLIGLGALVVLGIGSGEAAAVLVPLALVGGGIWLLLQNPREEDSIAPPVGVSTPPMATYAASPTDTSPSVTSEVTMPHGPPQPYPPVVSAPVPKRSRLRRFGLVGLFGFLGLIVLTIIAVPVLLFALIFGGDFDFDGEQYVVRPATIDDIPAFISEDVGEIRLDLRQVDFESISTDDDPVRIDIDLDLGRIEVLVPEDVRVDVDAEVDLGDVMVFGSSADGINPSRVFSDDDPQVDIDLDLNVGEIVVRRGQASASTTIEVN